MNGIHIDPKLSPVVLVAGFEVGILLQAILVTDEEQKEGVKSYHKFIPCGFPPPL